MNLLQTVYLTFIINPLKQLYLFGPEFMQLWGGKMPSEICQVVTSYSEEFWKSHGEECNEIVEKKFISFKVTIEIILYFIFLIYFIKITSKFLITHISHKIYPKRKITINLLEDKSEYRHPMMIILPNTPES
jgi:hypothetical protein